MKIINIINLKKFFIIAIFATAIFTKEGIQSASKSKELIINFFNF